MNRAVIAALAVALVFAGVARAEMPQNRSAPELTGRAAVGWGLVAHNGTWLYADGTSCGPECAFAFAWERCGPTGCFPIAGARGPLGRVHKVRAADVGFRFRVTVTATKYDCGTWNHAAGTQECRWVSSTATSAQSDVVAKPKAKKAKKGKKGKRKARPARR